MRPRARPLFLLLPLLAAVSAWLSVSAGAAVRAVVLGIAQDGGFPHIGCRQPACAATRKAPRRARHVACVGLVDGDQRFLIDATPDLPAQIEALLAGRAPADPRRTVDGILLTHAHVGHYTGLMYLGREALGARGVPVYGTPRLLRFLRENGPWSQLVTLGNVELRELEPGRPLALSASLEVTPLLVPHRDEFSDTVGYRVKGPSATLLYVPDIDKWEKWERRIEDEVARADVALLDGTFFDVAEVPGRSLEEIPHPLVPETAARLSPLLGRVRLIHLNHTNRLLWDPAALGGLRARGLRAAREGEEIPL